MIALAIFAVVAFAIIQVLGGWHSVFKSGFRVPHRGSVNPSPLGDGIKLVGRKMTIPGAT
jgi:hypothetical protein